MFGQRCFVDVASSAHMNRNGCRIRCLLAGDRLARLNQTIIDATMVVFVPCQRVVTFLNPASLSSSESAVHVDVQYQ